MEKGTSWYSAHLVKTIALGGLAVLFTSCATVSTYSGKVDDKKEGVVAGQMYYLPKALIHIKGATTGTGDAQSYQITITTEYVADTSKRYFLKTRENWLYDDDITLEVDGKGLLSSVNITATDKTADIFGALADIAAKVMTFGAGGGFGKSIGDANFPPPFDYTFSMDEYSTFQGKLRALGFELYIDESTQIAGATASNYEFATVTKRDNPLSKDKKTTVQPADGVVFRVGVPRKLTLNDGPWRNLKTASERAKYADSVKKAQKAYDDEVKAKSGDAVISDKKDLLDAAKATLAQFESESGAMMTARNIQSTQIVIPDTTQSFLYPLGRTPFVSRVDTLTFTNGMLSKTQGKRPSVILGFLQIPQQILKSISPLPLELKQTQYATLKADKDIATLKNGAAETPKP